MSRCWDLALDLLVELFRSGGVSAKRSGAEMKITHIDEIVAGVALLHFDSDDEQWGVFCCQPSPPCDNLSRDTVSHSRGRNG